MTVLGLLLILAGLALLVAEAHVFAGGALGVVGVLALAGGCWLALRGADAGVALAAAGSAGVAVAGATAVGLGARKALAVRRVPVGAGTERLVGRAAQVRAWHDGAGQVQLEGALWRARLALAQEHDEPPRAGEVVVVEGVRGLTLAVRRAESWEVES